MRPASSPLAALWGESAAEEFHERLLAATTPKERFRQLECALLARRSQDTTRHPAASDALTALRAAPQERTIAQVVDQIALSHRQFIQVFRTDVGMTPKRFCRVRRFLEIVQRTARTDQVNWAEIALACGYADQSHLTREFREFAGLSPTEYLRNRVASFPTYVPYVSNEHRNMIF